MPAAAPASAAARACSKPRQWNSPTAPGSGEPPPPPAVTVRGRTTHVCHKRRANPEHPDGSALSSPPVPATAVPAPLAHVPNALTVFRLALIPVFVAVLVSAEG